MDILARLKTIAGSIKLMGKRFLHGSPDIADENKTLPINNPTIAPDNVMQHEYQDPRFNIVDATEKLNESGEFKCKRFDKEKNIEESWVIRKPVREIGKETMIYINVTIRYDMDDIIFTMTMYGDGSEGLTGKKIESFYNAIHHLSSRTNGGYFTKHTYDETFAPIFRHQLQLSKMDFDSFKKMLIYCVEVYFAFKPYFDDLIDEFDLEFKKKAALEDPVSENGIISKFIAVADAQEHLPALEELQKNFPAIEESHESSPVPFLDVNSETGWSSWNSTTESHPADNKVA